MMDFIIPSPILVLILSHHRNENHLPEKARDISHAIIIPRPITVIPRRRF